MKLKDDQAKVSSFFCTHYSHIHKGLVLLTNGLIREVPIHLAGLVMLLIRGVFLPAGSSLSDQAQVLVNDELADARVGRGKEGEDNDDGYRSLEYGMNRGSGEIELPRGRSSRGIFLSFRRRWETV
jgi:hypothetical protein